MDPEMTTTLSAALHWASATKNRSPNRQTPAHSSETQSPISIGAPGFGAGIEDVADTKEGDADL